MFVRRAVAGVAASVLALALAGCAEDDPEPKFTEPTSSAPSPTPTESEAPERESAEDFIRRWVEAGDRMQITGETAEYAAMTPRCTPCQGFVQNVRDVYEAGGYAEFDGTEILGIERSGSTPPTFDVTKRVPETVIHRADQETETYPAGTTTLRVTLRQKDARWTVTHYGIL